MTVDLEAVRECDGYPALAELPTIDVDENTIRLGVALGLMRPVTGSVEHELTDRGRAVLHGYLARKRAELGCCGDPGDCNECGR